MIFKWNELGVVTEGDSFPSTVTKSSRSLSPWWQCHVNCVLILPLPLALGLDKPGNPLGPRLSSPQNKWAEDKTLKVSEGHQGHRNHTLLLSESVGVRAGHRDMHNAKTVSNILLVGKLKDRVSNSGAFTQSLSSKSLYESYT